MENQKKFVLQQKSGPYTLYLADDGCYRMHLHCARLFNTTKEVMKYHREHPILNASVVTIDMTPNHTRIVRTKPLYNPKLIKLKNGKAQVTTGQSARKFDR